MASGRTETGLGSHKKLYECQGSHVIKKPLKSNVIEFYENCKYSRRSESYFSLKLTLFSGNKSKEKS